MRSAWVSGLLLLLGCTTQFLSLCAQHDSLVPSVNVIPPGKDSAARFPNLIGPDSIPISNHADVHIESEVIMFTYPNGYRDPYSSYAPDSTTLRQFPNATVAEFLGANGVGFVKANSPGTLSTVTLRGTDAGHIPVYWAGVPVTNPMMGVSDLSLFPGSMLGNWSIQLGGSSLEVGGGGLGGILRTGDIKHLNSSHKRNHQQLSFKTEAGSFGSIREMFHGEASGTRFHLGVSAFHAQARNDYPFLNTALAEPKTEELQNASWRQSVLAQEGSVTLVDRGKILVNATLRTWYQKAHRELPAPMTSSLTGEWQADESFRTAAGFTGQVGVVKWDIAAVHLRDRLRYVHPTADYDEHSSLNSMALVANAKFATEKVVNSDHTFNVRIKRDEAFTPAYGQEVAQPSLSVGYSGLLRWLRTSSVHFHLREEKFNDEWSPLLGSVGVMWARPRELNPWFPALRANVTRNYRYPTLNMLYWNPGGNPDLLPESSGTIEGGFQWGYQGERSTSPPSPSRNQNLSVHGFWSNVENWIQWTPGAGGIWSPQNLRQVRSRGVEVRGMLERDVRKWTFELAGSYTFTDARAVKSVHASDPSLDKQLFYVPVHVASGSFMVRRSRTFLIFRENFTGTRYTTPDNTSWLPGFAISSASLGHTFRWRARPTETGTSTTMISMDCEVGVTNLFNASYQLVAWRPMPGRAFTFNLSFNLSRTNWSS